MAVKSLCILIALIVNISVVHSAYTVPEVTVTVLQPKGFQVSIPDSPGVELFAFHGRINEQLKSELDGGAYSKDIKSKTGDKWIYENNDVTLVSGNTIYYWVHVKVSGLGYNKVNQQYTVQ